MRVLILGVTGMLGSTLFKKYSNNAEILAYGTARNKLALNYFDENLHGRIICNVNIDSDDSLIKVFEKSNPDVVINCIGLVKQVSEASDPLQAIAINALFPHRIAALCKKFNVRMIHISTDCVYSGRGGNYREYDFADADDLYGRSKFLGEVDYPHAITLRTSIIGHELQGKRSLIDWFLSQNSSIKGYSQAFFSGLPTIELARVIQDFVLPNPKLSGLFHVSVDSISKLNLLKIVAKEYKKEIQIISDNNVQINRSLDSSKFRAATGFSSKAWTQLVAGMRAFG